MSSRWLQTLFLLLNFVSPRNLPIKTNFNTQYSPAPRFLQSWWASNSGGQLHCNASLSRGQWFLPMWKCKYQGVNCHSHLLAMTVGCLPVCPKSLGRAALTCQCQTQSNTACTRSLSWDWWRKFNKCLTKRSVNFKMSFWGHRLDQKPTNFFPEFLP